MLSIKYIHPRLLAIAIVVFYEAGHLCGQDAAQFQAGVASVDISPNQLPSIIAGGFLEGKGTKVNDPLYVKAFVLDDGTTNLVMAVVDTCMMPQTLIDEAKRIASDETKVPMSHMMVSATHTHSAPAAMGCLGTREDKDYTATLPGKIAEAIIKAHQAKQPAKIGWSSIDDWEHTHNRRWIRRPETKVVDPFGKPTGIANMHPGYLSPDIIGPSGPVDPSLSLIALQTKEGKPIGLLANYSQHYFGTAAISADYYGYFCKHMASLLGQAGDGNGPFVCAMSQGTSGDCMWMDYGSPQKSITIDRYAEAVARNAERALPSIQYQDSTTLGVVEKRLQLAYRVPDKERLEWAREIQSKMASDLPKDRTEVYAKEATILHERQSTELKLQAIRIGELSIAALPNEVYALTGLKLKAQSPMKQHFNIELANGAEGYIPPPEQHTLGGYTTWPARTAGLEVNAEPKIVETLLGALEEVSKRSRRPVSDVHGPYANALLGSKPTAYYRLNEMDGNLALNAVVDGKHGKVQSGYAWYLPGVGSGTGTGEGESLKGSNFSGPTQINRSLHLAGGFLEVDEPQIPDRFSVVLWCWLGEASGASERHGALISGAGINLLSCHQDKNHRVVFEVDGNKTNREAKADQWHQLVLIRDGKKLELFVDGATEPDIRVEKFSAELQGPFAFGKGLQGKLDEIAIFNRVLKVEEHGSFWKLANIGSQQTSLYSSSKAEPALAPLSPTESLQRIHVPKGFRVELAAVEPMVLDPVAFDWDSRGRLWVVEMADYPLGMDGKGKPGGRIRILEDSDRDGVYDKSQLFAEVLNFPNGILTWRDGVLVTAAPELLFLRDTDGDGKSDEREVLIAGFQQGNQQLRLNGLRWGIDNWVYCANGGHHSNYGKDTRIESKKTGKKLELGSRDFRFQPDTGIIELESGPTQFGRNRDAWGHWFGTQNANPLWHYLLPDRYSSRNLYVPTPTPLRHIVGPGSPVVFPASPPEKRFHSFEQSGRFTSACGGMIYGDTQLFGDRESLHSFVCEPFHNLVQHNVLDDDGISFKAHRASGEEKFDFFASEDRWCRPVMVRTGPDGALWVADMYRYMIEHPDWLPANGKEELLPHYRSGDDRGRIYRITKTESKPTMPVDMSSFQSEKLVAALDSSNGWLRDKAQQMLLWKNAIDAVQELEQLLANSPRAETRLQAMWTLEGLQGLSSETLLRGLRDPHPRVRENAIRIAEKWNDAEIVRAASRLAKDSDAKVRFQLALSAGEWKNHQEASQALSEIALVDSSDELMVAGVMSSAVPHFAALRKTLIEASPKTRDMYLPSLLRLALSTNDQDAIAEILETMITGDSKIAIRGLTQFLVTLERGGSSWSKLHGMNESKKLVRAVAASQEVMTNAIRAANDVSKPTGERMASLSLLSIVPETREDAVSKLSEWLKPTIAFEDQVLAIETLSKSGSDRVPALLAAAWRELSPALRDRSLDVWLSRNPWAEDLIDRVVKQEIPQGNIDPTRRDRLLRHPNKGLAKRASEVFQSSSNSNRSKVVDEYRSALKREADIVRGKAVYKRACAACHRRDEEGIDVGPNLATVVSHPVEKLLVNILDPNADILPGFQRYTCLLNNGVVVSGLLTSETANSITMKLADGKLHTFGRSEIESLQNTNVSLMPEELEKVLSSQDCADLIAFLRSPIAENRKDITSNIPRSSDAQQSTSVLLEEILKANGGREKLLRLFWMKERLAVSSDPNAKGSERVSVLEPPGHWWVGTNDRVTKEKEPAIHLVAAWTLLALIDDKAKLTTIPAIVEGEREAVGFRIEDSIKPSMDCYFDRETKRLLRIDWRSDKHLFSEWKEHDGFWYPSICVGYKIKDGKHWYHTEILEVRRLQALPEGLSRQ